MHDAIKAIRRYEVMMSHPRAKRIPAAAWDGLEYRLHRLAQWYRSVNEGISERCYARANMACAAANLAARNPALQSREG